MPCRHPTTNSLFVSPDLPNAHGLAVDWVSRNLFWTSYDTNKKQINVARLDGSFKNAVVQGLEQPHGLVVHPLRGSVQSSGLWDMVGIGAGKRRTLTLPSWDFPTGSSTGLMVTTSAWPTWMAAIALCSSVGRKALWVRACLPAPLPFPLSTTGGCLRGSSGAPQCSSSSLPVLTTLHQSCTPLLHAGFLSWSWAPYSDTPSCRPSYRFP